MDSYESTLRINQRPVLPFSRIAQTSTIQVSPIGIKVKSFIISSTNDCQRVSNKNQLSEKSPQLPSFAKVPISTPISSTNKLSINQQIKVNQKKQCLTASTKRFWWQWLLLGASATLLLPTSSNARNILEKAKIYLNLSSSATTDIPESGEKYLRSNQASGFNQAIKQARSIKPDSPFFPEAQSDIVRWSQVILDIAHGRASQGDFAGAIAAAKLISQEEPMIKPIAEQAESAIAYWKRQAQDQGVNQDLLETAKNLIAPHQASSYNQAIAMLRQVSPGGADYQEAQELMRKWSRQIYLIANSRAARGDFKGAIEAAVLVPKESSYYEKLKVAILNWQAGLPKKNLENSNLLEIRLEKITECLEEKY